MSNSLLISPLTILLIILALEYVLKPSISYAKYHNESATGIHVFPHPEPSSLLPPHTIPLGHPSAIAPSIQYRALNLFYQINTYYFTFCYIPSNKNA